MADPAWALGRFDLGFKEQIDFFRQKLNLPTAAWDDIWQAAHDRAFVVAGATKADLLDDLRQAVEKAISEGTTLETFRQDFRKIVTDHGWHGWTGEDRTGGEAWRTRVIYETNLRTAYAAGREAQLADPGLQKLMPFRRYVHNDSVLNPRPQHLAWHGLTLPHDHPFWKTHSPPNGWGCRCRVTAVLKPKAGDPTAPPTGWDEISEKTGAPVGIDKGWGYQPGASNLDELQRLAREKSAKLPAPLAKDFAKAMAARETPAEVAAREAAYRRLVPEFEEWAKEVRALLKKRKAPDYGLSDTELVALHLYTHDRTMVNYQLINRALRGSPTDSDMTLFKPAFDTINAALAKLPVHSGVVKRGAYYMPPEAMARYRPGEIVTEPAYLSAGKTKGFKGRYQYEITSKSGRDVSFLSNKPKEGEVLMPSGLRYHVIDVIEKGDVVTVKLEEIA